MFNNKVKDFFGKPAPAGYIAGLGRGASGFITRPDIGPARENIIIEGDNLDEEEFDENEVGLLGGNKRKDFSGFIDPEDDEADKIYAEIDEKMAERRKSRREANEKLMEIKDEASRPKTQLIFADLKRDLSRVSEAEWAALPEVGDFRIKRLKRSGAIENPRERFLPVPDSIHSSIINQSIISHENQDEDADFTKIGEARGKLLGMHLDQLSNNIKLSHDNEDEMGGIDNSILKDSSILSQYPAIASNEKLAEVGDLKRARQLFASIIKSNRKNSSGWISAARLEFQAGNQKQARALILKGTEECPKSEEIWFEALKLHENSGEFREILGKALKSAPESISLWIFAAEREGEITLKRKILRAALERNPSSPKLWMSLVELEESEKNAKLLLTRAVECAPDSEDLWLALARLQDTTDLSRQVLNKARLSCPKSFSIWINAARLEEANDTSANDIKKLLMRGAIELSGHGVELSFMDWKREAEDCEDGGDYVCASELIKIGVELLIGIDQNSINLILDYARGSNHITCSKNALYAILSKKPDCKDAIHLLIEKLKSVEDFDKEELKGIYESSLTDKTLNSDLWINYSRDFPNESLAILTRASDILIDESDQIKIWKEAIIIEIPNLRSCNNKSKIDEFVSKVPCYSELMIEVVRLYKVLGMRTRAIDIARDCTEKFPKEAEFWITATDGDISELKRGLEIYPMNAELALKIAQISDDRNFVQVTLEKTRVSIQKSKIPVKGYDKILVALCLQNIPRSCNFNILPPEFSPLPIMKLCDGNNLQAAKLILNQSLKELPRSSLLWYLAVSIEPRQLRRSKVTEALKHLNGQNEDEALLRWCLAMILDDKTSKETELLKALQLDPLNMDLRSFCTKYYEHILINFKLDNSPKHGSNWLKFIEENDLYFDEVEETFSKFIQ